MSFGKKTLIWMGITVILIGAVFVLLLIPFIQDVKSLTKENYEKRVRLEILKKQSSNLLILRRDYEKIQGEEEKISKVFIPKKDTLQFISTLENMALQNNVSQKINIQGINISELEQESKEIKELPIALNLSGSFQNIIKYLNQLETLDVYINFKNLSFSGTGDSTNLTISGLTYWQ